MQTYESGYSSTLSVKLNPGDTTMTVATVPTRTKGRLFLSNTQQKEWIQYTGISGNTLTGLTRGLSKTADPSTSGTGLTWIAGTRVVLVAMHDQLPDKLEDTTFAGTVTSTDIRFSGTTTSGLRVKSLTTAQREALTASNGDIVYDSTLGVHYQYIGGSWTTFATGTTLNASSTVAGKVEIATSAESIAGTDTGGTGALLSVLPSDIAKNTQSGTFLYGEDAEASDTYVIALTPTLTAYTTGQTISFKPNTSNTGACTINVNALGAKSIKLIDGTDPLDGDLVADRLYDLKYDGTNFVLQQVPQRATDAEVAAGTNTTDYITPKQAKDNYGGCYIATGTDFGTNATTIDFTHGLGRTPKIVKLKVLEARNIGGTGTPRAKSEGLYNGSTYACIAEANFNISSAIQSAQFSLTDRIGWSENENTALDTNRGTKITVTTMNSTTVTLTNTVSVGSAVAYTYLLYVE